MSRKKSKSLLDMTYYFFTNNILQGRSISCPEKTNKINRDTAGTMTDTFCAITYKLAHNQLRNRRNETNRNNG